MRILFVKSMIVYFQFFTRIVIPVEIDDFLYYLKHGSKFLPVFGLLLGLIEGMVFLLGSFFFTRLLGFILMLFSDVLLTGAMHQDGLADASDGLFSSRKAERMLAIMKDSRIGTMGTIALIFYYLFVMGIFLSYPDVFTQKSGFIIIVLMNMVAKSNMTLLFYQMNYQGASSNGLGQTWAGTPASDILIAQVISLLVLFVSNGLKGLLIYFIGIAFIGLYRHFVYNKVSGFNGDTLGASALISNVLFLVTSCVVRSFY